MHGRVVDLAADGGRDNEVPIHFRRLRIPLESDVCFENMSPWIDGRKLHPVKRTPPQYHRFRIRADIVQKLKRTRAAALTMNAPCVTKPILTAEREMSLCALIVAPDALIDVLRGR